MLFLVDLEHPHRVCRLLYEQISDLAVRWGDRPGARAMAAVERLPGRWVAEHTIDDLRHLASPVPENAARQAIDSFSPDVVIGSSVLRLTWRKIVSFAREREIPTVLYIREVEALNHLRPGGAAGDAVVANAESLAETVESMGISCPVYPSVVEVDVTRVTSSRRAALVINPVESRGIDTIWQIATQLPEVPFIVQESWPLKPAELATVQRLAALLPNVELRRREPPGPRLYRDARVLVVPYKVDNRPRVVAEAQANGIPVIVADLPALVEAAGGGGVAVDPGDLDAWRDAIRSVFDDSTTYEALCRRALEHSARREIDAARIAERFEDFLAGVAGRRR